MASLVAKCSGSSNSGHVSSVMLVQEKGSRNKRKFRADTPPVTEVTDLNKTVSQSRDECLGYEFVAESFVSHEHANECDMCSYSCEKTNPVDLDLGLSCSVGLGPDRNACEVETGDGFHDADWSDLTESQLEELVLANLDTIFRSAIKKIVSFGYTEEVATKAVLRSGLCYGSKDAVTDIVNNTLVFLKNGREVDSLREHHFVDLQQMEKYILAELVCLVREVRPFFSTGDAMWCLLVSDMNVSNACTMDSESLSGLVGDDASNGSISDSSEMNQNKETSSTVSPQNFSNASLEAPVTAFKAEVHQPKPKSPFVLNKFSSEKENQDSTHLTVGKSFSPSSQNYEEKAASSRKIIGINKRESIIRQKSVHLEKSYRTYGSKGVLRSGKLTNFGGLLLDKKLKSVSESTGINLKNLSLKTKAETANKSVSVLPKTDNPPVLLATDTELSLSASPKQHVVQTPDVAAVSNPGFSAVTCDKSIKKWGQHTTKDEIVMKLVPRVHELQNQMQEWTEWANQKVMQVARRLGKDKAELKTLRIEKEEVERLNKEKQMLEDNTMKKLTEMENALCKASGQVERANAAVRRLKVENVSLRREMEAANVRAAESAASCEEVSRREKKTLTQFQSWEKVKTLFHDELLGERRKAAQLRQDLELAKEQQEQVEARWKQEEKVKEELISQATSYRIGRLEAESTAKLREDLTRLKADNNLQRYKEDIENLEKEISMLSSKTDSLKIAALKGGVDGSYVDVKSPPSRHETQQPLISKVANGFHGIGGVKRERECVMCLTEEMCVVFLPCAHQVVCKTCNEMHEKQGMKDCPSCRGPIERRICVRYARS